MRRLKVARTRGRVPWQPRETEWAALMNSRGVSTWMLGAMLRRLGGAVYNHLKSRGLLSKSAPKQFLKPLVQHTSGYRLVLNENGKRGYEHRIVAERILGRPLCEREVVHHKNGNVADNRPENLEILTSHGEHTQKHHTHSAYWTPEMDDQVVGLRRTDHTAPEIAAIMGLSACAIRNREARLRGYGVAVPRVPVGNPINRRISQRRRAAAMRQ